MPQKFPFPASRANQNFPFNPFTGSGDPNDPAHYVAAPGVDFQQPWLAVPKGPAFIWPMGTEGITLQITPTVGIHKMIGSKRVDTDVVHAGEEHVTMSGTFPGNTGPASMRALRQVVLAIEPPEGKVLGLPGILAVALRVSIVDFSGIRAQDARGKDFTYTIEMVVTGGINGPLSSITAAELVGNPTATNKGTPPNTYITSASINTLRKVALSIYHDASKWRNVYNKNKGPFKKVPTSQVPDHKLPAGTTLYY